MMTKCLAVILAAVGLLGCGGRQDSSSSCPGGPPGLGFGVDAVFVADTGSSTVSAFQQAGDSFPARSVCGSPFRMDAPPTALAGGGPEPSSELVYLVVGSGPSRTLSLYRVDARTGVLTGPVATLGTKYTPTALVTWGSFIYAANSDGDVSVFAISENGSALTEIPGSPFLAGSGPAAITAADPGLLYVANSKSNDISGYLLDVSTGVPTPLPGSPYPAGVGPSSIEAAPPYFPNPPGGPTFVIVTNQGDNTVSVYSIAGNGALGMVTGSPFPTGTAPSSSATGNMLPLRYLYVTNSGSGNISGYTIDDATGALTPLPGSPFPAGLQPVSVAASIGQRFLYVANQGSNNLSVFSVDRDTGALVPVSASPFPVGKSPSAVLYFQVPQ